MATLEIELADDGSIAKVPEPIQKLIDKAFGQGQAKAADELRQKARPDPVEVERAKTLEVELSKLKEAEAIREKRWEDAQAEAAKRHEAALAEERKAAEALKADLQKRTTRIQELARKDIRAAALEAGARKESLDKIEKLLADSIGLDDALQTYVKDGAGNPLLDKDGKTPVTIEGFVAQYLADNREFLASPAGRGGGAPGGRSLSGQPLTGVEAEKAAALDRVAADPSIQNVAAAFSRIGTRAS